MTPIRADNEIVRASLVALVGLVAVGVLGAALGACGLSLVGSSAEERSPDASPETTGPEPDGSTPNTPGADASRGDDSSTVPPPPGCDPDACALPSGAGFTLALFGDAAQACPAEFASSDVLENPIAGTGACTCGDCTAQINCSTGSISTNYDNGNGSCGQNGAALQANNGVCRNVNGTFGENASVEPPTPVVGTCSAPGVASRAAVTTTARRICSPASTACTALACTPPTGMAACLVHDGDVACPASAPNKHLVGTDFTLSCASCGCTLAVECGGKMEFFSQQGCNGSTRTLNVNVCTSTNQASFSSTKWTGTVAQQTCTKGTPPAPAFALTDSRTVCCP